jgi:UDP-N-acetyl-D-glucosamine dehydrogenase
VERIARALNEHSKAVRGSKIAIIGVSYKPGVGDLRESPALKIIRLLSHAGGQIAYHDDHVPELPELDLVSMPLETDGYDCVAILTDHPGIDYEALVDDTAVIVDFRNATGAKGKNAPNVWKL